jgi:hypothetical protein
MRCQHYATGMHSCWQRSQSFTVLVMPILLHVKTAILSYAALFKACGSLKRESNCLLSNHNWYLLQQFHLRIVMTVAPEEFPHLHIN